MRMPRTLFSLLVVGLINGDMPAPACPVRISLWQAIHQSDLIGLARVERFENEGDVGENVFENGAVVLKTLETWKGPRLADVRVNFGGTLSSGGRRVQAGDSILVFLESGESQIRRSRETQAVAESASDESSDGDAPASGPGESPREVSLSQQEYVRHWEGHRLGRWFFSGPGTGVVDVRRSDPRPLRDLLAEAVNLQGESEAAGEAPVDWLIRAATVAEVREEAIRDLRMQLEQSESGQTDADAGKQRLAGEDLRRIAAAFTRDPGADSSVPELMSLLSGIEDDGFDRAVVSVIEAAVDAPQIPYWVPDAIRHLVVRYGRRDWGSEVWQRDLREGKLKEYWPAIARDLGLPAVAPARVPIDASTPDEFHY
jgi:hypothetical protein